MDPFAFIWSNLTGPNSQLGSAVAKRKLKKHKVTSPFRSFLSSTCFLPLVCQRSLVLYLRGKNLHKAFRIALWRERLLSTAQHTNFKDVQLFRFRYRILRKHYFHALYTYIEYFRKDLDWFFNLKLSLTDFDQSENDFVLKISSFQNFNYNNLMTIYFQNFCATHWKISHQR